MKAIYISGCIPYNGKSGGRLASYNHLLKISQEYEEVYAFFVDVEYDSHEFVQNSIPQNVKVKIFKRNIPPAKTLFTSIIAILRNIFSKFPRSMDVVYSDAIVSDIENIYKLNKNIIVILDHFDAFSNLYDLNYLKILYIAHNNESNFHYQKMFFDKKINFFFNLLNFIKTKYFEKILLEKSKKNIFISSSDYNHFIQFKDKSTVYPEFIKLKQDIWCLEKTNSRSILFLGSSSHYPNKEATLWLIKFFAPILLKMDSSIVINICGLSEESLNIDKDYPKNLNFLGRVDDETLTKCFLSNRVFLSPIVLGSGIKIKILEAASYCLPIFSTPESIIGLEHFDEIIKTSQRTDAEKFVKDFLNFFNDDFLLCSQSEKLFKMNTMLQNNKENYFTYDD